MGNNLRGRVDRLHATSGASEAAEDRRHFRRMFKERRAVLLYFLNALPDEVKDTPEVESALLDWIEPMLLNGHLGEAAPLLARMVGTLSYHGWIPAKLPAEWVRSCLAHPSADWSDSCEVCGLHHPAGKVEWVDCKPVHHPPHHPTCTYCGGRVSHLGYFTANNQTRWPTPVAPGAFLLAGGDLAAFDPKRKAT